VRDFVGGLECYRATKGVFVTTSYFPSTAYGFITPVSKRVVLIDGLSRRPISCGSGASEAIPFPSAESIFSRLCGAIRGRTGGASTATGSTRDAKSPI
jgi:hypothetical protein